MEHLSAYDMCLFNGKISVIVADKTYFLLHLNGCWLKFISIPLRSYGLSISKFNVAKTKVNLYKIPVNILRV